MGVLYGLLQVRSPAPPAIALVGLLGMLVGEQVVPLAKRVLQGQAISAAWAHEQCLPKITGLPAAASVAMTPADQDSRLHENTHAP